ncbi:MAG: sugar transferase [Acutalibacteraceae bacterium]|nr:sugar transferase [Acutalibacteraceae bacterium]
MPETLIKEPETSVSVTVSNGIYAKYIKRLLDFILSLCAIIVLSPILLVLTVVGAIVMKGNPFFVQERPGKISPKTGEEKIFKLIKFRTMTCEKDKDGKLLPDEERLTKYGNFIRKTSLDELPELFNILKGDMAIIGPRPLLVEYLPYYSESERHRHDVRPGLSGLAQINGRNAVTWEEKFSWDLKYVGDITFFGDIKIILLTVKKAFIKVEGVELNHEGNLAKIREEKLKQKARV